MSPAELERLDGLGAWTLDGRRCAFRVWAPGRAQVTVHLLSPVDKLLPLQPEGDGYHAGVFDGIGPGARYRFQLEGQGEFPDPASRLQPEGVHGPSQVVGRDFQWTDAAWRGLRLQDLVIYEVHVGAFSDAGTFDALQPHLPRLRELGVTAIELMPVAQFPGKRNWGYDGVYPFAVQHSYGGPEGLRRLVDACHAQGLGVILDVVYNHLGPEGNYLGQFGPYFNERIRTPWGPAINFDAAESDEVRRYFITNALYWIEAFHIDALRLDAVHAIVDASPYTFLEELTDSVRQHATRPALIIPESAANDARLIRGRDAGGYGMDAVWNDDFHHALRVLLTGERQGYYVDYEHLGHLEKSMREGFTYSGEYSRFRRRRHGTSAAALPAERFVVFAQNHDQVGNRMLGERLSEQVCFERLKLAAATVLLSPYVPLLFMGEEYGETARFPFFVSHGDADLIAAVRQGRREEFAAFGWEEEPPDPQSEATFRAARLHHDRRQREPHSWLYTFYGELLRLRREEATLRQRSRHCMEILRFEAERVLMLRRWIRSRESVLLLHLGDGSVDVRPRLPRRRWRKLLDSAHWSFGGPGSALAEELDTERPQTLRLLPWSVALYAALPRRAAP